MSDPLYWHRLQFGFTAAYHYIFPQLTMGLALFIVLLKVLANRLDVPYQSLMKIYLAERVREEIGRGRTKEVLAETVREPEPPYGVAPPGTHRVHRTPRKTGAGTRRRAAPRARR